MDLTRRATALGCAAAAVGGVALAVQSRVNGELGRALGDGVAAALVSFLGGLLILAAAVVATASGRAAAGRFRVAVRGGRLRVWQCLGGAAGASFVAAQGTTAAGLGIAVFTVATVAGQVVSSLFVDRAGFGPGEPRRITAPRAVGAGLTVVAVLVSVSDRFGSPGELWPALLPALAGAALSWAQAANGLVRHESGSVVLATLVNFSVGACALVLVGVVDVALRGLPNPPPGQWHLYTGGALGVVALSTSVYAVRAIGVLVLGLCAVAGQLVGAVLLDVSAGGIAAGTVAGVALTLVAAGVAAVPGGRARVRG
ncbi:putative inner membrane protein [Actinokineospora spheciospongiae]|uniref:Putative inner membrane protein n=1 Tax=Actinokineospora spheciospongiae TaxID=909613 RepID=W7IZN6_9PSEU|nr:DMT family transporter [Actinokineospora spheciospongiae]EWC62031.1 putative inner membrane protein [Actinokineospora spheciospongiae]